jgi:hypothetical protein
VIVHRELLRLSDRCQSLQPENKRAIARRPLGPIDTFVQSTRTQSSAEMSQFSSVYIGVTQMHIYARELIWNVVFLGGDEKKCDAWTRDFSAGQIVLINEQQSPPICDWSGNRARSHARQFRSNGPQIKGERR